MCREAPAPAFSCWERPYDDLLALPVGEQWETESVESEPYSEETLSHLLSEDTESDAAEYQNQGPMIDDDDDEQPEYPEHFPPLFAADIMEQCRKDRARQARDARRYHFGSAAVDGGSRSETEKEQQLRWVSHVLVAALHDPQHLLTRMTFDGVVLLQDVCLTQIGQQRMIAMGENEEEEDEDEEEAQYPEEVRVILGVVQGAQAELVRKHEEDPCNNMNPEGEVGILLEELRKGCWLLIDAPLWQDETVARQEARQDNGETRQVQALYEVLDEVWWGFVFYHAGDVKTLICLLRRLCWDILDPSWRASGERGS